MIQLPSKRKRKAKICFQINWTIKKDGESFCELVQSASSVIVKNEDKLKNKETLICELRQPIYDLPFDKLIGFITVDEFGQLRTISALNLSIQPNNPAILNYINRNICQKTKTFMRIFVFHYWKNLNKTWRK